jgi:hypothetical protein
MLTFVLVFSFLIRHKRLIVKTIIDILIINLIMSNEINTSTIIKAIICSIISFIIKL